MGFLRNVISGHPINESNPADKGKRRWLFNYIHAAFGVLTWITAVAAVYRGIELYATLNPNVDADRLQTAVVMWGIFIVAIFFFLDGVKYVKRADDDKFATPNKMVWTVAAGGVVLLSLVTTIFVGSGLTHSE